jgi:ceramide glucosyltransferase
MINFLLFTFCLSSVSFYCYAISTTIAGLGYPNPIVSEFYPPITILKPLCGVNADDYENLTSFCQQNYPDYQIIFAMRDDKDVSK